MAAEGKVMPTRTLAIANEQPAVAHSLWTATANPAPPTPPLEGAAAAEVAVIGGGFTGLSTALHLAERGISVALLEAESPGWGASGRNGGQVIPGLKHDPDELEALFGKERGARLISMAGGAADLVFALIDKHAIACAAQRTGWIQGAHDAAGLKTAHRRAADWASRGAAVEALDQTRIAELLGSEAYLGGLLDRRGGGLHPLNYALGLADAAIRAGARIHGQSRVSRIERRSGEFRLHTEKAVLTARRIVIGTNGYADGLVDPLRRSIVPVSSVQVASRPLSDNVRKTILPEGQVVSDTRRLLLYFRLDAEGRFIMGGRGAFGERGILARQADLRAAAERLFPQLGGIDWVHHWGGFVALTKDHLPHLHELEPGIVTGLGYNGRGVAMATAMGRQLAAYASGTPAEELDFPITGLAPIPFHGLRKPALSALTAWYKTRERFGL
jgi:glycine/D-amino acid oxidase-like deaminating enzyme